jgi:hypothetical protein
MWALNLGLYLRNSAFNIQGLISFRLCTNGVSFSLNLLLSFFLQVVAIFDSRRLVCR